MYPIADFYNPLLVMRKFDGGKRPQAATNLRFAREGVFSMKNRILGITALLAVALLGLTFTACPDQTPYTLTFTNESPTYDVTVTISGSINEVFELPKLANLSAKASTKSVVCKSSDLWGWSIQSGSVNKDLLVEAKVNGTGITFVNKDDGLFKIDTLAE